MMPAITHCEQCRRIFMDDWLLQAETKHIAATFGASAAEFHLCERLEEEHATHRNERKGGWPDA